MGRRGCELLLDWGLEGDEGIFTSECFSTSALAVFMDSGETFTLALRSHLQPFYQVKKRPRLCTICSVIHRLSIRSFGGGSFAPNICHPYCCFFLIDPCELRGVSCYRLQSSIFSLKDTLFGGSRQRLSLMLSAPIHCCSQLQFCIAQMQ